MAPSYICEMLFSAIIPTYNNLSELQGCLNGLDQLTRDDFEVHICVDGSTDGTSEWLDRADFSFPLLVHHHPKRENKGRAATRNLALPHINGKYLLFLDSDMKASPTLLDEHEAILVSGNNISIGSVTYQNMKRNLWVKYTSERGVGKYQHGAEVPFHYFITPNTALPAQWVTALGGFDPLINRYGGEDMELGFRIHQQFEPNFIYNGKAKVYTSQPKTLDEALPQLREYGATGLPYICRKWPNLDKIYWVNRCHSKRFKDKLFVLLTRQPFRWIARRMVKWVPYKLQKLLINYLVVSHVHAGYRKQKD